MAKAQKRQRKKEQRRQKIEEEVRRYRARRRRRLAVNLAIVLAVVGTSAGVAFNAQRRSEPAAETGEQVACGGEKPPAATPGQFATPPTMAIDQSKTYTATIETSCGTIAIELADDAAPQTVNSFVFLARQGFFDGLIFHRVDPGFVVQGGDPEGTGGGGPGYKVTEPPPPDTRYVTGTVAMAKGGAEPAGTSGSQFFVVTGERGEALPPEYALLGKVTSGLDVLPEIEGIPRAGERPRRTVYIEKITIAEV